MPKGFPDSFALTAALRGYRRLARSGSGGGRYGAGRGVNFGFKLTKVVIYKAQTQRILNTPSGKLWAALERRGNAIVSDAKRQVGVKTGALRASIHMRHLGNVRGQYLWIGSNKNYAYMHHEGTKPHTITADKSPVLVFRSGTKVIRTPSVSHPGTRANRYLSTPMRKHVIRPINIR